MTSNDGDIDDGQGGWRGEAQAVMNDVSSFVSKMSISENLPITESGIYFNLETKESKRYTIEMSTAGFRISGQGFDCIDTPDCANGQGEGGDRGDNIFSSFETIYALLDSISPAYRVSFSSSLASMLSLLQQSQDSSNLNAQKEN